MNSQTTNSSLLHGMMRILSLIVLLITLVPTVCVNGYLNFLSFSPPANLSHLPVLRLGSTFSTLGGYIQPGTAQFQSFQLCVRRANELGGVMHQGQLYAVNLIYMSDDSSQNLVYSTYETLTKFAQNRLNSNKTTDAVDILFAPHTTPMTLPALAAVRTANISLWVPGASSNLVFNTGYPYVWGAAALSDTTMRDSFSLILNSPITIETIAIVYRWDPFSVGVAAAARALAQTRGFTIVVDIMIPTNIAQLDPQLQPWLLNIFSGLPYSVDLLLFIGNGDDILHAAAALKDSGKAPKVAIYDNYYSEAAGDLLTEDGWLGVFPYRSELNFNATLPGVLFQTNHEFTTYFKAMYPNVQLTPQHAQQVACFEYMLAAVRNAASLSADDLRAANLLLDGRTFFSPVKYDPTMGHNPAQQYLTYQVQGGQSVRIEATSDIVYPYPWTWTIPVVYSQTSGQFGIEIVSLISLGLLVLVTIGCYYYKSSRVIHAASWTMLNVVIFGVSMVLVSAVLEVQVPNQANCTASFWLFNLGFTIALGAMFLKMWRVHSIFASKQLAVSGLTDQKLLMFLSGLLVWDIMLLAIRTGVSPFSDHPAEQMCELDDNLTSSARTTSDAMVGLLMATQAAILLAGAVVCIQTRDLPSLYNESSWLTIAVYNNAVLSLIWVVVRYIFDFKSNPTALSLLESIVMLLGGFITTTLIFAPKFVTLIKQDEHRLRITKRKGGELTMKKERLKALNATQLSSFGPPVGSASAPVPVSNGVTNTVTGTTSTANKLLAVNKALDALMKSLEVKIETSWKEYVLATQKVAAKKEEMNQYRDSMALVQAEFEYVKDLGAELSENQLQLILTNRANDTNSHTSIDTLATGVAAPRGMNEGVAAVAQVYRAALMEDSSKRGDGATNGASANTNSTGTSNAPTPQGRIRTTSTRVLHPSTNVQTSTTTAAAANREGGSLEHVRIDLDGSSFASPTPLPMNGQEVTSVARSESPPNPSSSIGGGVQFNLTPITSANLNHPNTNSSNPSNSSDEQTVVVSSHDHVHIHVQD